MVVTLGQNKIAEVSSEGVAVAMIVGDSWTFAEESAEAPLIALCHPGLGHRSDGESFK